MTTQIIVISTVFENIFDVILDIKDPRIDID